MFNAETKNQWQKRNLKSKQKCLNLLSQSFFYEKSLSSM